MGGRFAEAGGGGMRKFEWNVVYVSAVSITTGLSCPAESFSINPASVCPKKPSFSSSQSASMPWICLQVLTVLR